MPASLNPILLLFVILFLGLEARALFKKHAFKELIVASLLLSLGFAYGIDYAWGWNFLPNPNISLTIFKPISETLDTFFQVTD